MPTAPFAQTRSDTTSVFFSIYSHELSPAARSILDSFTREVRLQPGAGISIYGWASKRGNASFNQTLSERRGAAVVNYLLQQGVPQLSITLVKGEGVAYQYREEYEARRVQIVVKRKHVQLLGGTLDSLASMAAGESLVLPGIHFQEGTAILLSSSVPVLTALRAVLAANPGLKVRVVGHVCCGIRPGINDYSQQLSTRRAKSVYDFLVADGIQAARLLYEGRGFLQPKVYPEESKAQQAINRRVEIEVQ